MSTNDPFVSDPGVNDLSRLPSVQSQSATPTAPVATTRALVSPAPFIPQVSADVTELFILALSHEKQNPLTCAKANRLFFPVNPESFGWNQVRAVGTYDILNGPQATQLGQMQVRVFNLTGFFPTFWEADYCVPYPPHHPDKYGVLQPDKTPQEAREWLSAAQKAGFPLDFVALPRRWGASIFPKTKVVITNLGTTYQAGSPMDVFYELELTELVEPTIIRTSTKVVPVPSYKFTKHITKKGETLVDIARAAYGTDFAKTLWTQIRDRNKVVIYPHGVRKPLRDWKGRTTRHSNVALLPRQHLIIPKPKVTR